MQAAAGQGEQAEQSPQADAALMATYRRAGRAPGCSWAAPGLAQVRLVWPLQAARASLAGIWRVQRRARAARAAPWAQPQGTALPMRARPRVQVSQLAWPPKRVR